MIDLASPGSERTGSSPEKDSRSARQPGEEFAACFQSFFDSFRRQVQECYGKRSDAIIARAEEKVARRLPGFSLRAISPDNALSALDLAEMLTNEASVFKRRKLRQAALGALSELYNTHYETLERFQAVERVEQFYYRLKK